MTIVFVAFFAALAVLFAVLVVTLRQPMRAALALIAHMVSLAAIYACLEVHVVALFQVLIYVGAVMVFMVYTIMLLDDRDESFRRPFSRLSLPGLAVAALVSVALLPLVGRIAPEPSAAAAAAPPPFAFAAFAVAFLERYWFHFELATVLLLVGVVAAWTAIRETR